MGQATSQESELPQNCEPTPDPIFYISYVVERNPNFFIFYLFDICEFAIWPRSSCVEQPKLGRFYSVNVVRNENYKRPANKKTVTTFGDYAAYTITKFESSHLIEPFRTIGNFALLIVKKDLFKDFYSDDSAFWQDYHISYKTDLVPGDVEYLNVRFKIADEYEGIKLSGKKFLRKDESSPDVLQGFVYSQDRFFYYVAEFQQNALYKISKTSCKANIMGKWILSHVPEPETPLSDYFIYDNHPPAHMRNRNYVLLATTFVRNKIENKYQNSFIENVIDEVERSDYPDEIYGSVYVKYHENDENPFTYHLVEYYEKQPYHVWISFMENRTADVLKKIEETIERIDERYKSEISLNQLNNIENIYNKLISYGNKLSHDKENEARIESRGIQQNEEPKLRKPIEPEVANVETSMTKVYKEKVMTVEETIKLTVEEKVEKNIELTVKEVEAMPQNTNHQEFQTGCNELIGCLENEDKIGENLNRIEEGEEEEEEEEEEQQQQQQERKEEQEEEEGGWLEGEGDEHHEDQKEEEEGGWLEREEDEHHEDQEEEEEGGWLEREEDEHHEDQEEEEEGGWLEREEDEHHEDQEEEEEEEEQEDDDQEEGKNEEHKEEEEKGERLEEEEDDDEDKKLLTAEKAIKRTVEERVGKDIKPTEEVKTATLTRTTNHHKHTPNKNCVKCRRIARAMTEIISCTDVRKQMKLFDADRYDMLDELLKKITK